MQKMDLLKNPDLAKNRIFVGNLPSCTREELCSICVPYGKPIASMVKDKFGFIQFEDEATANKAAAALNHSSFKGHKITVRNADNKKQQNKNLNKGPANQTSGNTMQNAPTPDKYYLLQEQYHATVNVDYNDCEIIVLNKEITDYAEHIEQRLKRMYLRVDILYPNPEVPIGKVLANISSRGCLYAIVVTEQNVEHKSITVNILYGQAAEHRNMPIDDAINLIHSDFSEKLSREIKLIPSIMKPTMSFMAPAKIVAPPLKEPHPESMQTLLNLLADNLPLTVLQYDRVIKYLQERRELQVKTEMGEHVDASMTTNLKATAEPDPEIELQKKILNILNKPSVTDKHASTLLYPTVDSLLQHSDTIELLKDEKVQKALDSLMITSLVETIQNHFEF
ncbi:nuclear receptor coactivator 5 [Condylostylus longicornis]|uniref:nuclear receptor coactivator 5 n=1 Tax=Condylostylus longicornis TaxID=2530218 RepID=UPI00244E03C0|nr:nuclear receptor coactivator 5 [Condylostylus longicornis]